MIPYHLLQKFYAQMSEHGIATDTNDTWDTREYTEYMLMLRKAIRFFIELDSKDNQPY